MKWILQENESTETKRLYIQDQTGTQLTTEKLYTDKTGADWWGFSDLHKIPYIRIAFAKQISDLFTVGMTASDILNWCNQEKAILKAVRQNPKAEPEAYEKLYSMILEKEALVSNTVDPLQQHLGLCTLYVLEATEKIDYFDLRIAEKKIQAWKIDEDAVGFFLNWHTGHILNFTEAYKSISQIVSNMETETSK